MKFVRIKNKFYPKNGGITLTTQGYNSRAEGKKAYREGRIKFPTPNARPIGGKIIGNQKSDDT